MTGLEEFLKSHPYILKGGIPTVIVLTVLILNHRSRLGLMLTRIERLEQLEKAETKIITKEIQHINSKLTNLDGLITQNIVGLNKKAEKTAIADIKSDLKYIRDQQISRYEFDTFMNLFLKSTEKSP